MTTVLQKVRKGAKLLDEKRPDWFKQIMLTTLDMSDPCECTLGQLYGDIALGAEALSIEDWADYGFDIDKAQGFYQFRRKVSKHWKDLRERWRIEVHARRKKAAKKSKR